MGEQVLSVLAARRHVALRRLLAPGPDDRALARIFEAAAQAPDHARLRPWRFIQIGQARRADLADAFLAALVEREPGCDGEARRAARDKAFHAPCLLVAVLRDDPGEAAVPRAEKLVSLGCAIQNMLVAAQAMGFASGLASGGSLHSPPLRRLLRLAAHEEAVCFIGFGTAAAGREARPRPAPSEFVTVL